MKNKTRFSAVVSLLLTAYQLMLMGAFADANTASTQRRVVVIGRQAITVTTPLIRLGDLADISSPSSSDDEIIIGLQKLVIEKSPLPGKEKQLSAASIVEHMEKEGINLRQLGYTFPPSITVRRAARALLLDEISEAITRYLDSTNKDAVLKDVRYSEDRMVAPGLVQLEAVPLRTTNAGHMDFNITAQVENEPPLSFPVSAKVEQWGEVPVATRPITKGSIVDPNDVMMARMNLTAIPRDSAQSSVIGLETKTDIGVGEVFRRNNLLVPPVIAAGAKVTMVYRAGLLEATASGTALEAGINGQAIKVKNDNSRKIITGVIRGPGNVEVGQ